MSEPVRVIEMRTIVWVFVGSVGMTAAAGASLANLWHEDCGASTQSVGNNLARLDVWDGQCKGAILWFPELGVDCSGYPHLHPPGAHVLVLADGPCPTGALVRSPPAPAFRPVSVS